MGLLVGFYGSWFALTACGIRPKCMADVRMAVDTGERFAPRGLWQQSMHKVAVAANAGLLRDFLVAGFGLDRVVVVVQRECHRMEKPIVCFCDQVAGKFVRQMAIVADGDVMMAALLPGIKMVLHHVAVGARLGIVTEVTGSLTVSERERTDP